MKIGLCVLLLSLAACAGSPPQEASTSADEQYRKADSRIKAMEEFAKMRASCTRSGGVVVVRRYWASRIHTSTMSGAGAATCQAAFNR